MKKFLDEDFLLETEVAKELYHKYAKDMPIFDFHCHLNPRDIAENKNYKDISEVWLDGDHYKWRAMRSYGIGEELITGKNIDSRLRFEKWAETVPYTIGNPLYHWTHLELQRYFNILEALSPKTAEKIWKESNRLLNSNEYSVREIIKKSNVKILCTTDDPIDDLIYHEEIKRDSSFGIKVLPTFRPDKALNIEKIGFNEWVDQLEKKVGFNIKNYEYLLEALEERINFFNDIGCVVSDHALETVVYEEKSIEELNEIFIKAKNNERLSEEEIKGYKTELLIWLGKEYAKRNWVMQLHIGAMRDNSSKMFDKLGPDTGFDSIGDTNFIGNLSKILNRLDKKDELPKTILYCLNPRDNYTLGSLIGCFQSDILPGKIQFGSGWWFCDQRDGMEEQMKSLANLGLLSKFIGMLTDSRSFLSYTRHEYFRRILCNLIGRWVENGEYPNDMEILGKIVQDISYNNAVRYFGISE